MRGGLCPCEHSFNFAIVVLQPLLSEHRAYKIGRNELKLGTHNEEPIPLTLRVCSLIHLRPPCPHESRLSVARAHTLHASITP